MASPSLTAALCDHMKYDGPLTTDALKVIREQWLRDIEVLDKLIREGKGIVFNEESESGYYSVRRAGTEIAAASIRENAVTSLLQ